MDDKMEELLASTSIPDYIYKGLSQPFNTDSIAYIEKLQGDGYDVVLIFETIISKYIHCLRPFIIDIELSDSELYDYKFQPKKFCLDTYQTMELWSGLLYINNMVSVTEFKVKKLKVFTPQILEVLDDILALVDDDIVDNKSRVRYS